MVFQTHRKLTTVLHLGTRQWFGVPLHLKTHLLWVLIVSCLAASIIPKVLTLIQLTSWAQARQLSPRETNMEPHTGPFRCSYIVLDSGTAFRFELEERQSGSCTCSKYTDCARHIPFYCRSTPPFRNAPCRQGSELRNLQVEAWREQGGRRMRLQESTMSGMVKQVQTFFL